MRVLVSALKQATCRLAFQSDTLGFQADGLINECGFASVKAFTAASLQLNSIGNKHKHTFGFQESA